MSSFSLFGPGLLTSYGRFLVGLLSFIKSITLQKIPKPVTSCNLFSLSLHLLSWNKIKYNEKQPLAFFSFHFMHLIHLQPLKFVGSWEPKWNLHVHSNCTNLVLKFSSKTSSGNIFPVAKPYYLEFDSKTYFSQKS